MTALRSAACGDDEDLVHGSIRAKALAGI